jgi:hypothetical protein
MITVSNVVDLRRTSARPPKVKALKPNPQPKAKPIKLATRDPRGKTR